jgi:hypothetical protein
LSKDGLECVSVILAKIGDGFEVRRQPSINAPKYFRDPLGSVMPPMTAACCSRDLILSQELERRPGK